MAFAQNFGLLASCAGGALSMFLLFMSVVGLFIAWRDECSSEAAFARVSLMGRRMIYVALAGLACFVMFYMLHMAAANDRFIILCLGALEYAVFTGVADDLVWTQGRSGWCASLLVLLVLLSITAVLSQDWFLAGWLIVGACEWLLYFDVVAGWRKKVDMVRPERRSAFGMPNTEHTVFGIAVGLMALFALTALATWLFGVI